MKNYLSVFFVLLITTVAGFSQNNAALVEQSVAEYTALYSLSETQQKEMRVIENRRLNNLQEIAALEQSDYKLYLQKKNALHKNTQGSLRRMLTLEQREIHNEQLIQYRLETSDMIRQMRSEGKSKEEMELLMMERG